MLGDMCEIVLHGDLKMLLWQFLICLTLDYSVPALPSLSKNVKTGDYFGLLDHSVDDVISDTTNDNIE